MHMNLELDPHIINTVNSSIHVDKFRPLNSGAGPDPAVPDSFDPSGSATLYFHHFAPLSMCQKAYIKLSFFIKDHQCRCQFNPINLSTCSIFKLPIVLSRIRIWIRIQLPALIQIRIWIQLPSSDPDP